MRRLCSDYRCLHPTPLSLLSPPLGGREMQKLRRWRFVARGIAAAITTALAPHALLSQGTVTGRVTVATGGTPLSESRVLAIGTTAAATSGPDGRFTLRNIPAGPVELQVL